MLVRKLLIICLCFYAVAVYAPIIVPSISYKLTACLFPAIIACVIVYVSLEPGVTGFEVSENHVSIFSPLTLILLTAKEQVPELVT